MLTTVLGVFKGRRITVGDVLMYSRSKHRLRRQRALAFVASHVAASQTSSCDKRVVSRALGKWRGSTLAGYVFRGDEQTFKEKFRMPKDAFTSLCLLLRGSQFDCSLQDCDRVAALYARRGRSFGHKMVAARAATDPPSFQFKVAVCMYTFAHGGSLEVAADVASIGESTLRRWLNTFCTAIIARLKPIYMPEDE